MPIDLPGIPGAGSSSIAAGGQIATTILVMGEAAAIYSSFLPSWFTISSPFFHEQGAVEGNRRRIRQGELAASILTVGVAFAGSAMTGSPFPLIGGIVTAAIMVAGYEYALRNPATSYQDDPRAEAVASSVSWRQGA